MRKFYIILLLLLPAALWGQSVKEKGTAKESHLEITLPDTLTNEYLDTVSVKKKLKLNDYSLIGVQYGAALSQVMWNPSQNQKMLFVPPPTHDHVVQIPPSQD